MASWVKKDEALIERVDGLLSMAPVRRRNMFGSVAWFLEANDLMFAGAWGEGIMIRVGEHVASYLIEIGEAEPFDPMGGKPMREYVFLNGQRVEEDDILLGWLEQASEFAETLPPKPVKKKRPKKSG